MESPQGGGNYLHRLAVCGADTYPRSAEKIQTQWTDCLFLYLSCKKLQSAAKHKPFGKGLICYRTVEVCLTNRLVFVAGLLLSLILVEESDRPDCVFMSKNNTKHQWLS